MSRLDGVVINGDEERRYAGNMNMSFAYVEGESLIMGLKVSSPAPAIWHLVRCLSLLKYGFSATGVGLVMTLQQVQCQQSQGIRSVCMRSARIRVLAGPAANPWRRCFRVSTTDRPE